MNQSEIERKADRYDIFKEADNRYAIKLVERIVFTMVGVLTLAVLYGLLKSINL